MTIAENALATVARVFSAERMAGIAKRAVLRLQAVGQYDPATSSMPSAQVDLPCRAMLSSIGASVAQVRFQQTLAADPNAEIWLLAGVPRPVPRIGPIIETDPRLIVSGRQFEPVEGGLVVVEAFGGSETFMWTGNAVVAGDVKVIVEAEDLTVGIGALWAVVAKSA